MLKISSVHILKIKMSLMSMLIFFLEMIMLLLVVRNVTHAYTTPEIAEDGYHTMSLESDEVLSMWKYGNLGDGTNTNKTMSAQVISMQTVTTGSETYVAKNTWRKNRYRRKFKVTTGPATNVTTTAASLNGMVKTKGTASSAWFDYGTVSGIYTNRVNVLSARGNRPASVKAFLSGLNPSTTYYYRVGASNSAGTSYGSENRFSTLPDVSPPNGSIIINEDASYTSSTEVSLNLSANDDVSVAEYYLSVNNINPSAMESGWKTFGCKQGIASGITHTVALESDGTVWTWGYNGFGQLGDGTTMQSATHVQVRGLSGVRAIAAGASHTIALKSDGTVWAWGDNESGQLGDGTTIDSTTPVQVNGLGEVVAIACGYYHTIALKSDGTVLTWGYNVYGQLGDGTTIDSTTPVQVSGLEEIVAIAGGYYHSIAMKSDGTVWAWGYNVYGQLGNGTSIDSATPVQVSGLDEVVAVACGASYTMALKSDGTVWTWGCNMYGQLGDGTTIDSTTPVQVSGLSRVVAIAGGYYSSVVLRSDGAVWTWGCNGFNQLGDGTTTNRTMPVKVNGLSGVMAIAGGVYHTIVLKSDGTVWTWGFNGFNQLGDGTTINRKIPVKASSSYHAITINYVISSGNGTKEVYVWYKDAAGNVSAGVSDSITLDTTAPSIVSAYASDSDTDVAVITSSDTELNASHAVLTSYAADVANNYNYHRILNEIDEDTMANDVIILKEQAAPIANAEKDISAEINDTVTLDGSKSSDVDGDKISYHWAFAAKPEGSKAVLSDDNAIFPGFTVDKAGTYVVSLIVYDGKENSDPDTVSISTLSSKPVADAGRDQAVYIGDEVSLDGSTSWDVDGDVLAYSWAFTSKPSGSNAELNDATAVNPVFYVDEPGIYVIRLTVNDGELESEPDSVTISTTNVAPVAKAGANQSVAVREGVILDGNSSYDADGDELTYYWSFTSVPSDSRIELIDDAEINASFIPDVAGTYVVSLIVNDGTVKSEPDTTSISVVNQETAVISVAQETIDNINGLDKDVFNNSDNVKTLTNKIIAIIENIENEEYTDALNKLKNDILKKMDGCAKTGAPDKNDWIEDCDAQDEVFEYITEIIEHLEDIVEDDFESAVESDDISLAGSGYKFDPAKRNVH